MNGRVMEVARRAAGMGDAEAIELVYAAAEHAEVPGSVHDGFVVKTFANPGRAMWFSYLCAAVCPEFAYRCHVTTTL